MFPLATHHSHALVLISAHFLPQIVELDALLHRFGAHLDNIQQISIARKGKLRGTNIFGNVEEVLIKLHEGLLESFNLIWFPNIRL
jgi:hypothetical protein